MDEEHYRNLKLCLELARLGETYAFPNPFVGAVIAHNESGKILGKGFHKKFGEAHAEVNAINNVLRNHPQEIFQESTIYINLEPCAHHGKTPPCSDLIIEKKFKRVIFLEHDPNPLACKRSADELSKNIPGEGIAKMKNAGIEVLGPEELEKIIPENEFKELSKKSKYLNRIFFKKFEKNPQHDLWVTIKIASTADGRMVTRKDEARWITNSESRKIVHRMRSCHESLITGIGTILEDDPKLDVRHSPEELGLKDTRNPELIVLKSKRDFSELERSSLNIFKTHEKPREFHIQNTESSNELKELLEKLFSEKPRRIMLEAGPNLSNSFLKAGIFDEIIHFEVINDSLKLKDQINKILERYSKKTHESLSIRNFNIINSKNLEEKENIQVFLKKTRVFK